jgi:Tfp pilus assembly ATPase PilU
MNEILIALIAALSALLGGTVSGFATYKAATVGFRQQQKTRQLLNVLEDLEFMKEVEEIFLQRATQNEQVNVVSLKRKIRYTAQEKLGRSLSPSSEKNRISQALASVRRAL